jgi:hypothetical protein
MAPQLHTATWICRTYMVPGLYISTTSTQAHFLLVLGHEYMYVYIVIS